jgi:hypothetical protein
MDETMKSAEEWINEEVSIAALAQDHSKDKPEQRLVIKRRRFERLIRAVQRDALDDAMGVALARAKDGDDSWHSACRLVAGDIEALMPKEPT